MSETNRKEEEKVYLPVNNFILVEFEQIETPLGLIIPERYLIQEGDQTSNRAYGVTTNRRYINPQVVKVITGNSYYRTIVENRYPEPEKTQTLNASPLIIDGKRYFVHYGAYEVAKWLTETMASIPGNMFFLLLDPIHPIDGYYLGDEVFTEGEKTASGIYTTPYAEKKEGVIIKLTHIPENSKYNIGDEVVTIDSCQYPLLFEGKTYIRLKEREIIGIKTGGRFAPVRDNVMVRYIHDPALDEIEAENARRADQLRMVRKYNMKIDGAIEPLEEPKTVDAEVLATGPDVQYLSPNKKRVFIRRNFGCRLPNKDWIINSDLILWAYD